MNALFKKFAPIFYVIFLLASFFYVKSVLNNRSIEVATKNDDKKHSEVEIKAISVNLIVDDNGKKSKYLYKLKNVDTVNDLLALAREDGVLSYDVIGYLNSNELVGPSYANQQYKWKILMDNNDITNTFLSTKLLDNKVYVVQKY